MTNVPAAPGTQPIPANHVRLYHYTGADPDVIRREGLRLDRAKGESYGEPNLIWGSAQFPEAAYYDRPVVEFSVAHDDPRWIIGRYSPGIHYEEGDDSPEAWARYLQSRGSNVTFGADITPADIIEVHEPWHSHFRYFMENDLDPTDYQWLKDQAEKFPNESRALREYEQFKVMTHWKHTSWHQPFTGYWQWWLPNKMAADVQELALNTMDKLFGVAGSGTVEHARPDMQKLIDNGVVPLETIMEEHNLAGDNYAYTDTTYKDAIMEAARFLHKGTDPEAVAEYIRTSYSMPNEYLYGREYDKNDPDAGETVGIMDIAQMIEPHIRDYEQYMFYLNLAQSLMNRYPEAYKLLPWFVKQLKLAWHDYMHTSEFWPDHRDWQHAIDVVGQSGQMLTTLRQQNQLPQGFDINKMTYQELEEWYNDQKADIEMTEKPWEKRDVVATLSNGWTVENVTTADDLAREGELMGHCVGGYCRQVERGDTKIFSLRDPKGMPHVTMEYVPTKDYASLKVPYDHPGEAMRQYELDRARLPWTGYKVVQIQGKSDSLPKPEYRAMIKEFNQIMRNQGWQISWAENAWRHPKDNEEIMHQLRQQNTYHLNKPEDLDRLVADYMANGGTPWFQEQHPDVEDEYGIPRPSGVPKRWIQSGQLQSILDETLEDIYAGTIPPDQMDDWAQKYLIAYYSMLSQPYSSNPRDYRPKSVVDARAWLTQYITSWAAKRVQAINDGLTQQGVNRWVWVEGQKEAIERVQKFQDLIAGKTGTELSEMAVPDQGWRAPDPQDPFLPVVGPQEPQAHPLAGPLNDLQQNLDPAFVNRMDFPTLGSRKLADIGPQPVEPGTFWQMEDGSIWEITNVINHPGGAPAVEIRNVADVERYLIPASEFFGYSMLPVADPLVKALEEPTGELWPDYLPWGEAEQQYLRGAEPRDWPTLSSETMPNGADLTFRPGDRVMLPHGGGMGTVTEVEPRDEEDTIWVRVKKDDGQGVVAADWMLEFVEGLEGGILPDFIPWGEEEQQYYRTAAAVTTEEIPEDMLIGYRGVGFHGTPIRFAIREEGASDGKHPYFKDLDLAAFVDFFDEGVYGNTPFISVGYISTSNQSRGKGYARVLMQALYDKYPNAKIRWGKLMDDAIVHLRDDFRQRYPERTGAWKLAVNAIPAQYTDDDPLDLKGKQPVFENMQVDWWDLDEPTQRQVVINALRATMLSPRLKLRDNAIMYQEFMDIPADESDPDVFEEHGRRLKERWDRQGQGDLMGEVDPMAIEQQVPGKLTPGFWGNVRRLSALGPYASKLQEVALRDITEYGGEGKYWRQEVMKMGIPGVGPKVASFAWLALNPKGSDLGTLDVWMMRHLNQDVESPNNPNHYFELEDQLRQEKDTLYGPDVPLGQYQWGVWDKIRTPGLHQDHSPLRVHQPTPYYQVAWGDFARGPRPQRLREPLPGQEPLFA